jgi:hypothetical protein
MARGSDRSCDHIYTQALTVALFSSGLPWAWDYFPQVFDRMSDTNEQDGVVEKNSTSVLKVDDIHWVKY